MEDRVRDKSNGTNLCELCGTFDNLMLCAGCKDTWYCCKDHQKSHWKVHKIECKKKSGLNATTPKNDPLSSDTRDTFKESTFLQSFDGSMPPNWDKNTVGPNNISETQGKMVPNANRNGNASKDAKLQQDQREVKIADYVVKCLNDYGICVVDNFMSSEKCSSIFNEVKHLHDSGVMQAGELVKKLSTDKKVRGDKIAWVEKGDPNFPNISSLIHRLDSLIVTCHGRLGRYSINGRTKAMVACYPGNGTYYMRHVDNPNEDGRCVTCIYYINKDWDITKDGGLLRIFPAKFNQVADIEPKFDRLLFFWSDRRNPHEVQPAYKTRYAVTVWYFDGEERIRARIKHRTQVEDSAINHDVSQK